MPEKTDLELAIETIIAYKNYIDANVNLTEQERSDLLMIARNLDFQLISRQVYHSEIE